MTTHILGPKGIKAFENRGIGVETAVRFGTYTGRQGADGEFEPDVDGNVIAFPFLERGSVVAVKYRGPNKRFWQRKGGRRTFWNSDALDDPALEAGIMALVITEGELDALAAIESGFPLTVSVPDGAPAVKDGEEPESLPDADPEREAEGKFAFVWNNRDRLKRVKRFTLAVDNDAPGKRLAAELVRRLTAARCQFVVYPEGCKDLNDVLMRHGKDAVTGVLNGAKPYPVRGLYRLSDYAPSGKLVTYGTGYPTLDHHLKFWLGEFMVVTGIPGHGKSTLVTNLLVNAARDYGWRSAIMSPEMPVVPQYREKLRRILLGRQPATFAEEDEADAWINEHFLFIDAQPTEELGDDPSIEWVLERAGDAVLRYGIQALVIDPWNELEHARKNGEGSSEYIGRSIRLVKRFNKRHDVITIVVAHPTKDIAKEGKSRMPTLYDIDGSAHWFNKCDHGLIVHRPDENKTEAQVRIGKVRFEDTGRKGLVNMRFNEMSSRFEMLDQTYRGEEAA